MYPFFSEWIFCRRKTGTFSFYIVFKGYIELRRTSFNGFDVKWFYFIPLFCKTGTSCLDYILDRLRSIFTNFSLALARLLRPSDGSMVAHPARFCQEFFVRFLQILYLHFVRFL